MFGANDWLSRILPNAAQSTRSEFSYNKTMEWLKAQGEEQKRILITFAPHRRKIVLQEAREDINIMMKLQEREKAIEKEQERETPTTEIC